MARVVLEDLFGSHLTNGEFHIRVHQVDDAVTTDEVHAGDDDEPNRTRLCTGFRPSLTSGSAREAITLMA